MTAWFNRDDCSLGWQELVPYVGQTVTVEYSRWLHHYWSLPGFSRDPCTGVLQAVDDNAVTVSGKYLPYRVQTDGFITGEITTILLGGAAAISAEQRDALAQKEAYFAWERAGRPWQSPAEQDRMYFQAIETVRQRQESLGGSVIYQPDRQRLKTPGITDEVLLMPQLNPAAWVTSFVVRPRRR